MPFPSPYVNWSDPATGWVVLWTVLTLALATILIRRMIARQNIWTWPVKVGIVVGALTTAQCLRVAPRLFAVDATPEGRDAPLAFLSLPDGQVLNLKDLRGHVVLLDFWATWCAPCRASFPAMDQLSSDFAAAGLIVAGISADQDLDAWRQYLRDHRTASVQVLDKNNELAESFEGIAKPTFILLDARGRIRWRLVGWRPLTYRKLRREIVALLQETGNKGRGI